jgi:hypothetical protein
MRRASLPVVFAVAAIPSAVIADPISPADMTFDVFPLKREDVVGPHHETSKIIFLNRCVGGCNMISGQHNAITNSSPAIPTGGAVISEFEHGDATWNAVVQCVRELYSPYDVMVTDVDPGGVPHHEAIVAGSPVDIGYNPMAGGFGFIGCDEPLNNVISFNFANVFPPDPITLCEVVAQESGHTWGLSHVGTPAGCSDPMSASYTAPCGRTYFRNKLYPCGELNVEQDCICGGPTQNSHVRILGAFGMGQPIPLPTVDIMQPAAGPVASGFLTRAQGTAARGFGKAEFYFNGYKWGEVPGVTNRSTQIFDFAAPMNVPDGVIDVEVRIYDDLEYGYGSEVVTVTKGAPCTSADQCLEGQRCEAGKCFWDPPMGEFGAACEYDQFCLSGRCPEGTCTQSCIAGVTGGCPDGYACGGGGYCVGVEPDDVCCSVGEPTTSMLLGQLGLCLFVFGGLVRRRRRG